ncbi:tryptophan 7-halogenase [Plantactinospora sp. KLBMP9567]|uniref:tryptophan 7-halogenase n=1 Tax=Plantactinospora sp. KLBMP9567 TaxID=3085900 RepID=UPI00298253D8|nr:tryptophan 7-halogenase [Plantactinospora sp. KLBMP9567]MDW5329551.1 tryptophan 7-halogenase [Plantactinospora sp. KLBMP9567]
MTAADTEQFDVVVVGGGPAGSSLSTLVAMRGHRVLLLEKEKFPRYQIGESLLPATVLGTCNLLGVGDELRRAGFTVKRGGSFKWGTNPEPWTLDFVASIPGLQVPEPAYQVERMKFDDLLLRNARRNGVDVRENCTVGGVLRDGDRVTGVRFVDREAQPRTALARYVVDASGNGSRIHQEVSGQRIYSDFFRNIALFGYFRGGKRLPAPYSGNILSAAFKSGWFWYIPLRPDLTSVGAVVSREMADKVRGDREQALRALIAESPLISDFLDGVPRVTEGVYGTIRTRKDYSYSAPSFWRPGMVLVGDAACFVDPVLSSGVHLATYSGLLAARSINAVLAGDVPEATAFDEFESRYRREYGNFYEFLVSFYDRHVDENSYFWSAKKITNHPASDLEAFTSLVGGLTTGEQVATEDGIWQPPAIELGTAAGRYPDWDTDRHIRFDPRHPIFEARQWVPGGVPHQGPRPGGLIPSSDGLQWTVPASQPSAG